MKSEKKYRFVPKTYGRGFTPISWQGWLMTLVIVALLMLSSRSNNLLNDQGPVTVELVRFLFDALFLVFGFSRLAEKYTDGELKWRRGKKDS